MRKLYIVLTSLVIAGCSTPQVIAPEVRSAVRANHRVVVELLDTPANKLKYYESLIEYYPKEIDSLYSEIKKLKKVVEKKNIRIRELSDRVAEEAGALADVIKLSLYSFVALLLVAVIAMGFYVYIRR